MVTEQPIASQELVADRPRDDCQTPPLLFGTMARDIEGAIAERAPKALGLVTRQQLDAVGVSAPAATHAGLLMAACRGRAPRSSGQRPPAPRAARSAGPPPAGCERRPPAAPQPAAPGRPPLWSTADDDRCVLRTPPRRAGRGPGRPAPPAPPPSPGSRSGGRSPARHPRR